ncbi:MAG: hypothetical protein ACRC1K_05545, partial [Planctomycetia bacterium]
CGGILLLLATSPTFFVGGALLVLLLALLGTGNGAVFQLVPQVFSKEIGVVTGIVGAAGGFGGFLLPTLLGTIRQYTGSYAGGLVLLGVASFGALLIAYTAGSWRTAVEMRMLQEQSEKSDDKIDAPAVEAAS